MHIHVAGSRPTRRAPAENFTGAVWQDPIIAAQSPARVVANRVAFEPGARTAWHTHPLGQTLYVISGVGRIQTQGEPVREIKAGDVVWIAPGEKHWHGGRRAQAWFTLRSRSRSMAATRHGWSTSLTPNIQQSSTPSLTARTSDGFRAAVEFDGCFPRFGKAHRLHSG